MRVGRRRTNVCPPLLISTSYQIPPSSYKFLRLPTFLPPHAAPRPSPSILLLPFSAQPQDYPSPSLWKIHTVCRQVPLQSAKTESQFRNEDRGRTKRGATPALDTVRDVNFRSLPPADVASVHWDDRQWIRTKWTQRSKYGRQLKACRQKNGRTDGWTARKS